MRIVLPLLIIAVFLSACATQGPASKQAGKLPLKKTTASPVMTTSTGLKIVAVLRVPPIYPQRAQFNGIQGCVRVVFQLDDKGLPTHLQAVSSSPNGVFDQAAIQTVAKWRFRVTDKEGHPATAGSAPISQNIVFSIYGTTTRAKSIIDWICDQPPPRTLIVSTAVATARLAISAKSTDDKWVDVIHMPNPHNTPLRNGWVNLGFCIEKHGQVAHASAQNSSPKGLYDKAALAALKTWDFEARTVHGKPHETCGLSYHIPVIGAGALVHGPAVIDQRPTAIPVRDLAFPTGKAPTEGHVTLQFCIGKDGSVSDVKAIHSGPSGTLDKAAIQMLHVWQYWPKTVNGRPVRSCNIQETVVFKVGQGSLVWAYPAAS